jgi:pimeloyl-ACP methyl ester carboxylesterase
MNEAGIADIASKPAGPAFPAGVLRLEYRSLGDQRRDWALMLPPARGTDWVVMIHGHGSHGDQLYTRPDIRDGWLPALRRRGLGILTPNLRDNAWMSAAAAADLHALLAYVRETQGARRFFLASGSMGGTSNLIYPVVHPEDVAGVVALCPATDLASYWEWLNARRDGVRAQIAAAIEAAYGGTPAVCPQAYRAHSALANAARLSMPVYIVHGARDELIPVSQARCLATRFADSATFKYEEMADGGHDSPLVACERALDWVLDQAKPGRPAPNFNDQQK